MAEGLGGDMHRRRVCGPGRGRGCRRGRLAFRLGGRGCLVFGRQAVLGERCRLIGMEGGVFLDSGWFG